VEGEGLWPDAVLEVRPVPPDGGEVVWEWHAWDHLVQDRDPGRASHGRVAAHPERIDVNFDLRAPARADELRELEELAAEMRSLGYAAGEAEDGAPAPPRAAGSRYGSDWLHTNAIDYHPGLDLIVLSSPHLSEVWVIDHSTTTAQAAGSTGGRYGRGGDLLWRWGNPANHGAGTDADRRLFAPHDAQWIPDGCPGAGNLLVFNNGQGRPGGAYSSIEELLFSLVPGRGFARGGAEPVWSYRAERPASFYAAFMSGCQRLPNGNTLVCDGPQGRIFEVTRDGEVVWDYWNPFGGDVAPEGGGDAAPEGGGDPASPGSAGRALFRATRVAPDHPGLRGRLLAPETPAH
jgi:hypothetical protein